MSTTTATVTLPASITVDINGAKVTATGAPAKSGNIWFEAVQQGQIADDKTIEDALLNAVVSFEGETISLAKRNVALDGSRAIAISQPRKYGKDHAKVGQNMPGTGGNQTVSFVRMLPTWGERGYMLRVTLTGIDKDGRRFIKVSVACQQAIGGGNARIVGEVEGALTF